METFKNIITWILMIPVILVSAGAVLTFGALLIKLIWGILTAIISTITFEWSWYCLFECVALSFPVLFVSGMVYHAVFELDHELR